MSVATKVEEKTEKKESFAKHAAVYGLGTLATQLVSILLLPLYTKCLVPADFGALNLIYKISDIFKTCLMSNGIRLATLNFWGTARDVDNRKTIASTVAVFSYLSWIVSAIVLLIFAKPISAYLRETDDPWVIPVGVAIYLLSATTFGPLALMQARLESVPFVIASVAISLLHFSLAFIGVAVLQWGVWGVTVALAIAYGGVGLVLTIRELRITGVIKPDWQQFKALVRFSAPFIPAGLLFFVLIGGDQIFLARIAGKEAVGIYSLGYRIATAAALLVITPLQQVWSAWMYTAYKEKNNRELFGQAITRILYVYMIAALGLVLLKTELLTILSAEDYLGAVHVVTPIVVSQVFLILANLMDASLYVTRKTNRKPYIAAASATVMCISYYVVIRHFHEQGLAEQGAAYASLIGLAAHALFTYLGTRSAFSIKFEFGRLAAAGALTILFFFIGNAFGDAVILIPYKLSVWAGWIVTLWYSGLLSQEEKGLVENAVRNGIQKFSRSN